MIRHIAKSRLVLLAILASTIPTSARTAFDQGVASGDVTETQAMLWTRTSTAGDITVEVAIDSSLTDIRFSTRLQSIAAADFVIKADATGLEPATTYFYRFREEATGATSPLGTFRTSPAEASSSPFRFVYSGDSNAARRPFRVLKYAADEDPNFWIWAGDTIYGDVPADTVPTVTDLTGYRAKHRQNREDPYLRSLLARSPVWSQWDDHEVANDYDGGDLEANISDAQRVAGQQAFFDYMPIRSQGIQGDPRRIYRSFRYGQLAEFFVLDCRQYRSADLSREGGGPDPHAFFLPIPQLEIVARLEDSSRTMLGATQLQWLKESLSSSTARWKFVLSSVPFTSLLILPYDRWDGYEAERYDLLHYIDLHGISGVILLSADIHANIFNPDVTLFQRSRLGADYSPCFRVPEFVAGPIATETFRQEVTTIGAEALNTTPQALDQDPLLNLSLGLVTLRVALENRISFIELDRFAYLLVDVTENGVSITHKGIVSDETVPDPPLQVLNRVELPVESPTACGSGLPLPICLITSLTILAPVGNRMVRSRWEASPWT